MAAEARQQAATQAWHAILERTMDNAIYQITGGQPTPAAARSDVVAIAQGCGLAASAWAVDEEDFARRSATALAADQPTLIAVRIDDSPGVGTALACAPDELRGRPCTRGPDRPATR
jgi:thiamine pyrophosphate-dependent acetolactate synthase large subunit-like protein